MNDRHISMKTMFVFLLTLASIVLAASMLAKPAYAVQCGDLVRTDVKLTADLGPCPGDGLILASPDFPPLGQTISLNGHRIIGSGTGNGLRIIQGPIVVKGPGKIENFAVGVSFDEVTDFRGQSVVYDLTLENNITGILLYATWGVRVFDNIVRAGQNGKLGIGIYETSAFFSRNLIVGHSEAGIGVMVARAATGQSSGSLATPALYPPSYPDTSRSPAISENIIMFNNVGIVMGSMNSDAVIRGNKISRNLTNGIQVINAYEMACIIENNEIDRNGENGILLGKGGNTNQICRINNNRIRHNLLSGIRVATDSEYGELSMMGNRLSHNGTDIYWNQVGSPCWEVNVYRTSEPSTLPSCTVSP